MEWPGLISTYFNQHSVCPQLLDSTAELSVGLGLGLLATLPMGTLMSKAVRSSIERRIVLGLALWHSG